MDNQELVILLSVYNAFDPPRLRPIPDGYPTDTRFLPHGYPGRLAANINCLWLNTNVLDKGYPIYVQLDNLIYDECWPDLDAIGFPEENILRFDAPPTELNSRILGQHYYMFSRPELSEFKRILAWDIDLFFLRCPHVPRYDMDMFLRDRITPHLVPNKPNAHYSVDAYQWDKYESMDIDAQFQRTKQNINAIYPGLVKDDTLYHSIIASYVVYPRDYTRQGFEDFAVRLTPIVGDDQLILELWLLYTGETYDDFRIMKFVERYDGDTKRSLQNMQESLDLSTDAPLLVHYKFNRDHIRDDDTGIMGAFYRRMGVV